MRQTINWRNRNVIDETKIETRIDSISRTSTQSTANWKMAFNRIAFNASEIKAHERKQKPYNVAINEAICVHSLCSSRLFSIWTKKMFQIHKKRREEKLRRRIDGDALHDGFLLASIPFYFYRNLIGWEINLINFVRKLQFFIEICLCIAGRREF